MQQNTKILCNILKLSQSYFWTILPNVSTLEFVRWYWLQKSIMPKTSFELWRILCLGALQAHRQELCRRLIWRHGGRDGGSHYMMTCESVCPGLACPHVDMWGLNHINNLCLRITMISTNVLVPSWLVQWFLYRGKSVSPSNTPQHFKENIFVFNLLRNVLQFLLGCVWSLLLLIWATKNLSLARMCWHGNMHNYDH